MSKLWTYAKLGDIADVQSGGTPSVANSDFWGGDIPWYSSGELNEVLTVAPERRITEAGLAGSNAKLFPAGSLLVGMYDTAAMKMSILDRDAAFNQAIAGVKPNDALNIRFVFYALNSIKDELLGQRRGVRQKNLSLGKVREFPIPLCPLGEQHRIVTLLDEAFEGIATAKAHAEQNLQRSGELFDLALNNLLQAGGADSTERSLADVCEIKSVLVDPRDEPHLDMPHVGAGNIVSKTGELIDVLTARQEQLISGKFGFDESMVLYSKIRPYLMKVVRPDFCGLCSADIYPLVPKPDVITRDYLYYVLLSEAFTAYAIQGSARAGMPKVNREHLFAYRLRLPSVHAQQKLTVQLDALASNVKNLQTIYQRKLTALDELKQSLLHQAFTGQL